MPNYQSATLSASAGDVYTQLMDIIKTYIEARGWTTNLYEDYGLKFAGDEYIGKRLHAQKTINSIDRFINIRSMKNQRIFRHGTFEPQTGIGVIASTAYDGATHTKSLNSDTNIGGGTIRFNLNSLFDSFVGATVTVTGTTDYNGNHTVTGTSTVSNWVEVTAAFVNNQSGTIEGASPWQRMTGFTGLSFADIPDGNGAAGGGAIDLPSDVLTYYLFSESSGDNIYLICGNSTGYTGIAFGATSTGNYFVSGATHSESPPDINCNTILAGKIPYYGQMALRKKDNSGWYNWPSTSTVNTVMLPKIDFTNVVLAASPSFVSQLLYCSPDNFKVNNPLFPAYISLHGSTVFRTNGTFAGIIPGIKYVNMKFMDSLTELTFGGDVYKLFRLYTEDDSNDSTIGLAILK